MKRLALTAVLLATSCTTVSQSTRLQSVCAPQHNVRLAALTSEQSAWLAGTFRLVQVENADSLSLPYAFESALTLQIADSAERIRSRARRIPLKSGDRQLIGIRRWPDRQPDDSAEVTHATLFVGCRQCFDAGADGFFIDHISFTGFSGTWYGSMGNSVRVNSKGRTLPDPGGYFCAQRLEHRSPR